MDNLQYFCDKFIEYILALDMGIEIEKFSSNNLIHLHFYNTKGRSVARVVKIWIDELNTIETSKPVIFKVVYIGDSNTILSDYTKLQLKELKNYFDLMVKVVNRLNTQNIPSYCFMDDSLLKCLKRSYIKNGKRLKVVEV